MRYQRTNSAFKAGLLFSLVGSLFAIASCSTGSDGDGNGGTSGSTSVGGGTNGGSSSTSGGSSASVGGTGSTVGGSGNTVGGTASSVGGTGSTVGGTGSTSGGTSSGGVAATTGGSGTTAGAGNAGGNTSGGPAGYWTSKDWHGCTWTGVDVLPMTTTASTPKDFTMQAGSPYCVSGTVHASYEAVALLGFNLAEPAAGASCAYKPVDTTKDGPPAVAMTGTGLAVNFTKKVASTLRVQIQGPKGASDANDRWCYTITDAAGPIFAPWASFNTKCWEAGGTTAPTGKAYNNEPVSAVVFLVPGTPAASQFDYCVNGFAAGTSAADAPTGGGTTVVTGSIGGPGSDDLDFQRVKVKAGGKSYIIQNNNWGKPTSSDQKITYSNNSFTIDSSTGSKGSAGEPASFPSIYIGANGSTQNGLYSTTSDDGLPKQISAINTINTTFKYNRASGDYNAAYDVWFSASPPTAEYQDAISGFVMVWLYKPGGEVPIGSVQRPGVSIAGVEGSWDVWVGPRGGSGPNSGAPVVSYVRTATTMSMTFDLKKFIADAATHGIQNSWYLTDVFAGFEIWTGSAANGLKLEEFTAVVQ